MRDPRPYASAEASQVGSLKTPLLSVLPTPVLNPSSPILLRRDRIGSAMSDYAELDDVQTSSGASCEGSGASVGSLSPRRGRKATGDGGGAFADEDCFENMSFGER